MRVRHDETLGGRSVILVHNDHVEEIVMKREQLTIQELNGRPRHMTAQQFGVAGQMQPNPSQVSRTSSPAGESVLPAQR